MTYINHDDSIEIPPEEECEGTVIWLHGLGASGNDFVSIVPHLQLPQIRFIFPHAPQRPVTINQGWVMRAWYDILTLGESPCRESLEDVQESHQRITELIDAQIHRGMAPNQIIVAGFSQGGAIAMHSGLRYPATLGGIMALSTYLVAPDQLEAEIHPQNEATPMLFCHGTQDSMVPASRGKHAHDTLATLNEEREVEWNDFPMDHEICTEEIQVIKDWMYRRFGIQED